MALVPSGHHDARTRPTQEGAEVFLEVLGLDVEVGAVQPGADVGIGLLQQTHRMEQDVDALVVAELAEEADARTAPRTIRLRRALDRVAAVVLIQDALGLDAPVEVP